jgi:type II secretory pathway pseudopilin PulG
MPKLNYRGDTIVEVMITLAILGLAFAISYASANRSLIVARNAEEHSEVNQYIQSQVELLRDGIGGVHAYESNPDTAGLSFCMDSSNDMPTPALENDGVTATATCTMGLAGLYHASIDLNGTGNGNTDNSYYTVTMTWDGVGDLGTQQEQIFYREYN